MARIDVDQVLESGRLRGPVLVVLLCAASTLILDGFDNEGPFQLNIEPR